MFITPLWGLKNLFCRRGYKHLVPNGTKYEPLTFDCSAGWDEIRPLDQSSKQLGARSQTLRQERNVYSTFVSPRASSVGAQCSSRPYGAEKYLLSQKL